MRRDLERRMVMQIKSSTTDNNDNDNNHNNKNNNPLQGISNLLKRMDDVIDDFMCKRMGNGEVFYGKRKYNPSGKVDGVYNGMGMSDKTRIDMTREYKEMVMEERRRRLQHVEESRDWSTLMYLLKDKARENQ